MFVIGGVEGRLKSGRGGVESEWSGQHKVTSREEEAKNRPVNKTPGIVGEDIESKSTNLDGEDSWFLWLWPERLPSFAALPRKGPVIPLSSPTMSLPRPLPSCIPS